jgi:N-acetylglucosaminyl-diphospho-decaprenol L-rhamnosyltransferase
MRLAIIILNYRTPDLTIDCLASLDGQLETGRDRVIVVDNASGDDSADRIESAVAQRGWQDWVTVRRSAVNGGFAAGNNLALREVQAEFYVLLNSDTLVRPGTMSGLLAAADEHPQAGLLGPSFEEGDGRWSASCFRDFHPISELVDAACSGPVTRLFHKYEVSIPAAECTSAVDWVGFACVLIRRPVIEQIGLLDDGYFMYFEDADYCRRARAGGWQVVHVPQLRVVHFEGSSSGINPQYIDLRRRPRYYYAARARYYRNHCGQLGLVAANLLWNAGRVVSWLHEAAGNKRPHARQLQWRDIWTDCFRAR